MLMLSKHDSCLGATRGHFEVCTGLFDLEDFDIKLDGLGRFFCHYVQCTPYNRAKPHR